ncbi:sigma-54 dependent transcriptional regulator [Pleionea sp. CnH1-48]|uniref:sigma-54-dependent transcriptional regulator n=1 Tax=Pleionea sp. CnH1-48 TaxID=2954494 RepID=UPI002097C368|nr:sigma-54 dependent transcriptional regulator [Pleionea sp. CnH1-48]MCO7226128.1 sigma-54 dependent transcriptional regulator [Pleionea sp. CnH1-48]
MNKAKVLVVEDDNGLREALSDTLEVSGYDVVSAECVESAIACWGKSEPDMVVSDIHLGEKNGRDLLKYVRNKNQRTPFILMTAYGTIDTAVAAMQEGANEFLQKPFEPTSLLKVIEQYQSHQDTACDQPVICDEQSQSLYGLAEKIAQTDSTVLLNGPSGAGKEVMARYIHQQSQRSEHPFIAINCAAIPENMLEATLFGYEKGAYTGAHQSCPGKFEQAQNGTLLLDEISEMDLALQAKLLRVIQEREVERLGARKSIELDVRIIATTNRDLMQEVQQKRFREDLYYRLNVFPLRCLGLAERSGDIIPIAEMLLNKYAKQNGRKMPELSVAARSKLISYSWPGNVRELDNVMQRCLILCNDDTLLPEHLMFETTHQTSVEKEESESAQASLGDGVRHHEYQLIIDALKRTGRKKDVADELGISPRTLRYKLARMREMGYDIPA